MGLVAFTKYTYVLCQLHVDYEVFLGGVCVVGSDSFFVELVVAQQVYGGKPALNFKRRKTCRHGCVGMHVDALVRGTSS